MLQGLQNMGNTCSINTLIQCIGHCEYLRNWLLTEEPNEINYENEEEKRSNKLYMSKEMARITREMWVDNKSLAPIRFLKAVYSCLRGMIRPGEQLDICELWMLLVDKINSEVGKQERDISVRGEKDVDGFLQAWKSYNEKCMSRWLKQVQGWTTTSINCDHCKKCTRLYEPFCSLSLDIQTKDKGMDKMFETMFQKEQIGDRECDLCNTRSSAEKSVNVSMYPNVLVCCFKRFKVLPDGSAKKITDAIQIPINIHFENTEGVYRLCSIGNHVGSIDGGHYYATAKNSDGKWYIYDDINITNVEDITPILKNNKSAYILFYELDKTG